MLDPMNAVPDKIQTVTSRGQPVPERITSVAAARSLYKDLYDAGLPDARRRARVQGMKDGNPPYSDTLLKEMNLGFITNVNFLEMRAILDQKASAHYELFFEVPTLVEVKQVAGLDPQQPAAQWGQVVAEEFTRMLFDWSGFLVNMDKARREADVADIGIMIWRDEWDWRPKAYSRGSFVVDPQAELDIETLGLFFVRDRVEVGQLYDWALADEGQAKEAGWAPDAVKALLKKYFVEEQSEGDAATDAFQTTTWESIQQQIRNNDVSVQTAQLRKVKIIHMCVKEVKGGGISHYIFPQLESPEAAGADAPLEKFLFRKVRRFETMANVLWWLPYNYGDGYVRSVRGLGAMIEQHCDLSNRHLGKTFDAGGLTASLLLQPENESDYGKLQLIRMGFMTVVPPGVKCIQSTFQPQLQPLVDLRNLSVDIMRNNTGVWRPYPEVFQDRSAPKTARQVAEESGKEARMEKVSIAYDYEHLQRLYREMFRRATKATYLDTEIQYQGQAEARKFIGKCVQRGVPRELLVSSEAFEVYVTRAIGQGSWGVKMDITNQIMGLRGLLDEPGQVNALRDWLAVRVGYQNVDRYRSLQDRDTLATNAQSMAMLENNDMSQGQDAIVGSDQPHAIHIIIHIAPIVQVTQAAMESGGQGLDLAQALNILGKGLPHVEQHNQYLLMDPQRKELTDQVTKVIKAGVAVFQFLQKAQQAQQQAQQKVAQEQQGQLAEAQQVLQDRDLEAKMLEINKKYELKASEQASLNQMRAQKTADQMQIRREGMQQEVALKAERQAAEIELARQETAAKVARQGGA